MTTYTLVAAVAENGVIGADGDIPWHHPADLARFKRVTVGHPVVMGRRTYESIVEGLGQPLPDRTSVVLSTRDLTLPAGAVHATSLAAARELAERDCEARGVDTVYVVGGASVYEAFLPEADRMVLTEIPGRPAGDTVFPEWDADEWVEREREQEGELAFVTYERR